MGVRELQGRLHLRPIQHRLTRPLRRMAAPVLLGPGRGLRVEVGESILRIATRAEVKVERALLELLGPGAVFYDIGANIGWYSLLAARAVGPAGAVVAFEPSLENAYHAERNARVNGFAQMTVVPAAVADRDGWLAFRERGSLQGGLERPGDEQHPERAGRRTLVPAVRLDTWLSTSGLPAPTVVKIDVEGAELEVLRGMRETLASKRPALIVELHGTRDAVADELDAAGYAHSALASGLPSREAPWSAHLLAKDADSRPR